MSIEERIKNAVLVQVQVMAAAIIKETQPRKDVLSQRQAFELFGRAWVIDVTASGMVSTTRTAHQIKYSRLELETLRAVEQTIAKEQIESLNKHRNEN